MNKECENCVYYEDERDMGGGSFYVCANENYSCSWPEFKGSCPYLRLKTDIVIKELKDLKKYYHNGKFALIGERRYQALCIAIEILNSALKIIKEEEKDGK